jgi:two-component system, OmpR family, response regulator QseB
MRILLIEDDRLLSEVIQTYLSEENYVVDWLKNKNEIDTALHSCENFDLVIIDLTIPGWSWKNWLKVFKSKYPNIPVLVVSATNAMAQSLELGADAFLQKRLLNKRELLSSIHAILRRQSHAVNNIITYKDVKLDLNSREVIVDGNHVELSRREFTLLHILLTHIGEVVERKRLIESLYGWQQYIDSNALEVHVHNLRRKLKADYIKTVRGIGYTIKKD